MIRTNEHTKLSRRNRFLLYFAPLLTLTLGTQSRSEEQSFSVKGSARVRYEHKNNADFTDSNRDTVDFLGSRFRLDMSFNPNENVMVFFQPQFTKTWGEKEWVPSSATGNTSTDSSGALNDTGLDVHQAYLTYKEFNPTLITMGRKELAYGDHLLVGNVGWHNVGRAFDLIMVNYTHEYGNLEAFSSKVVESNSTGAGPGDKDFSGLYLSNKIVDLIDNLDAYLFYVYDGSGTTAQTSTTYGLRAKSTKGLFDYRAEATGQTVHRNQRSRDESQIDAEFGFLADESHKVRISAEYFVASNDFDQLFPTGHKWLGYADLFSRRNIEGYRIGVSAQATEKTQIALHYHSFSRNDDTAPAYKFNGSAYSPTNTEKGLATEIDLVVGHKLANLDLEVGYSKVTPDDYLETGALRDDTEFYYVQVGTNF